MSNLPICPNCKKTFPQEDFCPDHGLELKVETPETETASAAIFTDIAADTSGVTAGDTTADTTTDSDPIAAAPEVTVSQPTTPGPQFGPSARGDTKISSDTKSNSPLEKLIGLVKKAAFGEGSGAKTGTILPDEITREGWRPNGSVGARVGSIDCLPVVKQPENIHGYYYRYRAGALTSEEIYQLLIDLDQQSDMPRVWHSGTADFADARCDYDLISAPAGVASGLDKWLADSAPSEQRALHLLPHLAALLKSLHDKGVTPIVLDPTLLERMPDGALRLGTAGALEQAAAGPHFRADFARNPLLSRDWAAPELIQTQMFDPRAAVFSAGQLIAYGVWGQACSHGDLSTGAVAFGTIADGRLARVLMGCLWPKPDERWSIDDLVAAAGCESSDAMPETASWASLTPGAVSTAFHFAGCAYWRLDDMLAEVVRTPEHWNEATHNIGRLLDWVGASAWGGQAGLLSEALSQGRSPDWVLIALIRAVRPASPLTWRHLDLSDDNAANSLVALAQRALRGDTREDATVRDLFRADLRGAFTATPANH